MKKVTITCRNEQDAKYIFSLLTDPLSGHGCLLGKKPVHDEHVLVNDIYEFILTDNEIRELETLPQVVSINEDHKTIGIWYNKLNEIGIPRLASYTTTFTNGHTVTEAIPHSLYYGQTYKTSYTQASSTNGSASLSLSSIDCSNVDILIIDSGIDPTHPEFTDYNGNPTVVQFDWTQLKDTTGATITNYQNVQYYSDTYGHGTSCASLIAGKRGGFAKNAKIYALRSNELGFTTKGFDIITCLKLATAFQLAKKSNLYGLSSSRPTVFSNSWGTTSYYIANDFDLNDQNNLNFSYCFGGGKGASYTTSLHGQSNVVDGYFRTLLQTGVHCLVAAGNNNSYLVNDPDQKINVHLFRTTNGVFSIVRTEANDTSFILNQVYNGYTYGATSNGPTTSTVYMYGSPNIGIGSPYTKTTYPIIVVGDVSPVGYNDRDSSIYWTGGTPKAVYTALSGITRENRIVTDETVRYKSVSGPFFVKTGYSSFGPLVDIWATGNGTWAALSNQASARDHPYYELDTNQKYVFFNGTSAATPIVAGMLATYLSEYPSSSPLQARNWLLGSAVKGNIMKTVKNTLPVTSYTGNVSYTTDVPFGANASALHNNPMLTIQLAGSPYNALYRRGNVDDILYSCRFFDSPNLLAQAYPLRKAVLFTDSLSATVFNTTLEKNTVTSESVTHTSFS